MINEFQQRLLSEQAVIKEANMKAMYTELQLALENEMPKLSKKDIEKIIGIAWGVWREYL